jgi:hypothetical protein
MPTPLYLDVHVPVAIAQQLRRRGVDVVHATEEGTNQFDDAALFELATREGRAFVTQDIRFRVMAEDWQRQGKPFAGLFYGHQLVMSIGEWVADLELIAKATEVAEWANSVNQLPL